MKIFTFLLLLSAVTVFPLSAQNKEVRSLGEIAPDFALPYATKDSLGGADLRLSSLLGSKAIVLAFYPADWSGGCTKEVCTLRDNFASLADLNAEVLGISGDYEYSHHEWAKHNNLPFRLISDHRHEAAKAYNSYNETAGYNRRTVYVIDKNGKIAYIDLTYSVRDMESFEKLKKALKDIQ
jgi:peroxiredoxin Q/BCP